MSDNTTNNFSLIGNLEIPDSIDNAIENLTDKPTASIGQTFADIWYLVFGRISYVADKVKIKSAYDLGKYKQELNTSINKIPPENRIEPSVQVAAQALENSKYCISSDILRKMFVNLISGTMNIKLEPHIHPSFPEILKQLSENDAKMLKVLKKCDIIPVANIGTHASNHSDSFVLRHQNITLSGPEGISPSECAISIFSLQRAGLVDVTYSRGMADESGYDVIKESSIYQDIVKLSNNLNASPYFKKGICQLTTFGREFILVCVE